MCSECARLGRQCDYCAGRVHYVIAPEPRKPDPQSAGFKFRYYVVGPVSFVLVSLGIIWLFTR